MTSRVSLALLATLALAACPKLASPPAGPPSPPAGVAAQTALAHGAPAPAGGMAPALDPSQMSMAGHACACGPTCHCGHCSGMTPGCHCKTRRADEK